MKTLSFSALLGYGLFGLPLALIALPIYVYVPQFYAEHFGLSLSLIGGALLLSRVLDAFLDPAMGWWIDARRVEVGYARFIVWSMPLLIGGFIALFHPPALASAFPFVWFLLSLIVVYVGFSLATIAYQSWGAALTQASSERSRLTATREACGLIGVIAAAALTQLASIAWLSLALTVSILFTGLILVKLAPRADVDSTAGASKRFSLAAFFVPFANARFRWLFAVFLVNGIAAAIPATLFLFFAKDKLQLGDLAGIFLILYFVAAALSMPIWAWLAGRFGEARAWLGAMVLAIVGFGWTYTLQAGDAWPFGVICILSGLALGADLSLPPALLAAVIRHGGHSGQREGAYFGAWNWAGKMNLALAAGIALPLLEWMGYTPGQTSAGVVGASATEGLHALSVAYGVLPCLLKCVAASLLWRAPLHDLD